MNTQRSTDVSVLVRAHGTDTAADYALLTDAVARVTGEPLARLGRHCPHCGSTSHGRVFVASPPGITESVHVSLARAGGFVAVAVSTAGPVGIDIEEFSAVRRGGFDDVAFNATERVVLGALSGSQRDRARTRLWTSKEAVLKLTGEGLRADPRALTVSLDGAGASVSVRGGSHLQGAHLQGVHLLGFEPGPGLAGTVAVRAATPPRLTLC